MIANFKHTFFEDLKNLRVFTLDDARIEVSKYPKEMNTILKALNLVEKECEEPFLTDESRFSNFNLSEKEHKLIEQSIGVNFHTSDFLWEVCERISQYNKTL